MTVAEAMKVTLERDFGVPVRWIENQSRSTYANAELSAQRLRNAGVQRFYLVSHAWHMPRAMLSFEAAGLEPIPAPTRFLLPGPLIWRDFLRSEEHTSELQSLMRISYAVLCLKKQQLRTR